MTSPAVPSRPTPGQTGGQTQFKEFRCTWKGCLKSFSRAEHLHRHALNHNEDNGAACERCSAVFKRKDLLDRHKARHKEKDEEAGGEGLGRLLTRKRLWRDATGTIVAKRRPEHEKEKKRKRAPSSGNNANGTVAASTNGSTNQTVGSQTSSPFPFDGNGAPISPPGSLDPASNVEEPVETFGTSENGQFSTVVDEERWNQGANDNMPFPDINEESYDWLNNASWGTQPFPTDIAADVPYDDIFAPDTASSFNMPFTTSNYYSWLFGDGAWPAAPSDTQIRHEIPCQIPERPLSGFMRSNLRESNASSISLPAAHSIGDHYDARLPPLGQEVFGPGFGIGPGSPAVSNAVPPFAEFLAMSRTPESGWSRDPSDRHGSEAGLRYPSHGPGGSRYVLTPTDSRSSYDHQGIYNLSKRAQRLPVIDDNAREGVLQFIEQARPKAADASEMSTDHPFLSLDSLQHFLDLYFRRFNVSYPLLHRATFDPANVDPLLLMAVLQIGATYSTAEDHLVAITIHNAMRGQIFGHPAFNTRPKLWQLQTILLVECFGKSRAGQLQHDMSHLFHGLLINLIRRSDCQSARCQPLSEDIDLDSRWRAEVDAEERRRLALLCFMWDTQHAVLFSQSLCMNAAELKLLLPWDSTVWEADNAEDWWSASSLQPAPVSYLSVLRAYINPEAENRPTNLNGLSRVLALHGLMSVAWDLNRRDQTSLGISLGRTEESWRTRLARSYNAWKTDFDTYAKETTLHLENDHSESEEFARFATANIAIYHAAHIILNVEIIDLQIFAGATHILGRPVGKIDQGRSMRNIRAWAKPGGTSSASASGNGNALGSLAAAKATTHAAHLLRDGIRKLRDWDAGNVFLYPWCLYLATLTCWAFQVAGKNDGNGREYEGGGIDGADDEDADWDSKAEMNALVSAFTRSRLEDLHKVAGRYRVGDLPKVIARHLGGIRWAVVQEGVVVLRGLGAA